jgi:hypothetical protein
MTEVEGITMDFYQCALSLILQPSMISVSNHKHKRRAANA